MALLTKPKLFNFTNPYVIFSFQSQGHATTAPPPAGGAMQFLIGGPDLTEQFVTHGHISAGDISYLLNPLSRRTV